MASQLMLFETDSTPQKDGSLIVRPKRLCTGQEIHVQKACGMLGFRDRESIYRLIDSGEIRAWKPKSARGNGKWRIDLQSVLDYKAARLRESGQKV